MYIGAEAYEYLDAENFSPMILDTRDQFSFTLSAFTVAPMVDGSPVAGGYHIAIDLDNAVVGFNSRATAEQFRESLTDSEFWDKLTLSAAD